MDWRERYKNKLISPDEAASKVKSGDYIAFTWGRETYAVGLAIAVRKEELKDVRVLCTSPTYDYGWYDEGWQDSFQITIGMPTALCQEAIDAKRVDVFSGAPIATLWSQEPPDILLVEISPPDDKGFCSFGSSLWDKKERLQLTRDSGGLIIAEVNDKLIRTYGDNFVHESQIDYLVEHMSAGTGLRSGSLAGRELKEPEPYLKNIAENVGSLINDGDCLQIGVGRTTEPLVELGMLAGKNDLGWHSEATPPGIISLVRKGVITGKYKTLNPGKVVVTSIGGSSREEMEWVNMNPLFWLVNLMYLEDVRTIAAHDNMTAINNALMIDITGQITAESIGTRLLSVAGGQPSFVFGALQARGGKAITVLPSTAQGGKASRIVSQLPTGTVVTVPRTYADHIVTEYGIARLRGKSFRERAKELISVAHPDFRSQLEEEARVFLGGL